MSPLEDWLLSEPRGEAGQILSSDAQAKSWWKEVSAEVPKLLQWLRRGFVGATTSWQNACALKPV